MEFQCEAVLPVLFGEGEEVGALGGAGVVDQDVETTERRDGCIDRGLGGGGFAQVAGDDRGGRAVAAGDGGDAGGDLIELGPVARGQAELYAFPRQFGSDRRADAAAGAGDQRDLAGEIEVRIVSLPVLLA